MMLHVWWKETPIKTVSHLRLQERALMNVTSTAFEMRGQDVYTSDVYPAARKKTNTALESGPIGKNMITEIWFSLHVWCVSHCKEKTNTALESGPIGKNMITEIWFSFHLDGRNENPLQMYLQARFFVCVKSSDNHGIEWQSTDNLGYGTTDWWPQGLSVLQRKQNQVTDPSAKGSLTNTIMCMIFYSTDLLMPQRRMNFKWKKIILLQNVSVSSRYNFYKALSSGNLSSSSLYYTALLWQKEASDKSDISWKRAKCVCHFHWRQWNIHDVLPNIYLLEGWVFMHKIWSGRRAH